MGRDADIVVVGAGITGVATARALAQAGRGVVLVEQFGLGHDRGSSHGASRIFRLSYPDPHYVRLAQGALQSWRELEAEGGEELIVHDGRPRLRPGRASRTRARSPPAASLTSCSRGRGGPALADLRRAERRPCSTTPDGGITLADRAYAGAPRRAAVEAGAVVLDERRVTGHRAGPRLGAGRAPTATRSRPRACVVAAGAWGRALLAGAEIELPVVPTRETVTYFGLPDALACRRSSTTPSRTPRSTGCSGPG